MTRAVFALHGFTGRPAGFDVLRAMHPDARFVTPALLGHGAAVNVRTFDDEVERLCDLSGSLEGAILLGYSLGGRLALAMLARGAKFARAVIIGASAGLATATERASRRADDARLAALLRTEGIEAFARAWEAQPLFASQAGETYAERRAARRTHDAHGLADALDALGLGAMPFVEPALASVTTPIDYLVGEHDAKFMTIGARLAHRMPNLRVHVIPGVGHDVLLESPSAVSACLFAPTDSAPRENLR